MLDGSNLKHQIKKAVEKNKPDLALKLLSELYEKHSSINLVIQLKAQFKKLKDDSLSGIVSRQERNTETNIVTKKVLDLVDGYEVENIETSHVVPLKSKVNKKEISGFNETSDKNIELVGVIAEEPSNHYNTSRDFIFNCNLKLILKNISNKSIDKFYVELTLPKALTREPYSRLLDKVPKIQHEEKKTFNKPYDEKLFPNKEQEIEIGNLYVISKYAKVAFSPAVNLEVKVYTDDGDCKFEKPIKDLLKLEYSNGKIRELELKDF